MKRLLILASFFCYSIVSAQETSVQKIEIKLKNKKSLLPAVIDTLFINKDYKINERYFTKISLQNGVTALPEIQNGRYVFKFSMSDFFVLPIPVVVCSKCSHLFEFEVNELKEGTTAYFTSVEVSPSYIGGYKSLEKEFKRKLTSKERKQIKNIPPDLTVHFFITTRGEVSDITFSKEVSGELKAIIFKGLYPLKNWRPAMINGRTIDGEYTLLIQDIL